MDDCKVIADLLPSYCDALTSPESAQLVEKHIAACPQCASQLVRMRNRRDDEEQEKRREEFRRALPMYELNHKVKVLWIVLACAIVIIGFFVLHSFSMELALLRSGVSLDHVEVVSATVPHYRGDPQDTTYGQLIWSRTKDGKAVLACLEKNILGCWYVSALVIADSYNGYNPDSVLWTEAGWNGYGDEYEHYSVAHVVFVGDNAVKHIDFPQDELPEGARALVRQKHNHYMIYVTGIMESGTTYVWNIRSILEEHGFITTADQEE